MEKGAGYVASKVKEYGQVERVVGAIAELRTRLELCRLGVDNDF